MIYNINDVKKTSFIKKYTQDNTDISLFGSFPQNTIITLKVYILRKIGADKVFLELYNDDNKIDNTYALDWLEFERDYDIYTINLDCDKVGLFYYQVYYNTVDGIKYLLNEMESISSNRFSLLIHDKDFTTPKWFKGRIMYHIFVDRFNKAGKMPKKSTAIINEDWYNGIPQYGEKPGAFVENNIFFGGNIYGIIEKLDYISSLGVGCLYLSPIFDSYSNHKYDTGDYMKIDSMFGGEAAFDRLIEEAKKLDIEIILDGVFSHTGDDSKYFNKYNRYKTKGAYQSKRSPFYKWYKFKNYPDEYDCWWNVKILPELDKNNPTYRNFINGKDGVIRHYIKKGIAGWRLDVADELPSSFIEELRVAAKEENQDSIIIGEIWEDASNKVAYDERKKYLQGHQIDSVMNYPLKDAIISFICDGNVDLLYKISTVLYEHYPKIVSDSLMNILGTHDTERILTVIGGEPCKDKSNEELSTLKMSKFEYKHGTDLLKLAYLIQTTMYGVPCIYYGDEAGIEGYRDPFNRRCYPWGKEDTELIEWYKKLGQIRTSEKVFIDGIYNVLYHKSGIIVYERSTENEKLVIAVNRSEQKFDICINENFTDLITGEKYDNICTLDPNRGYIFKNQKQ